MPMDPLDPYAQLVMEAPPSPDYIPGPEAPPSPNYIQGRRYITDSEHEMEPEEDDGDNEKSEGDSIEYPTSRGDGDADDDGDDLSEDDADDEDEEESSDSEEEEEEHLALTVPALSLYSSGIGNSSGIPIGGVLDRGARINVYGAADLIRTIDALVRGSIICSGGGSGVNIGNGIRNGGNGYDVSETGDSDGVGMASNLLTSDSKRNGI
nr:hypothetical protein [Tanacetum cinerariifolium]